MCVRANYKSFSVRAHLKRKYMLFLYTDSMWLFCVVVMFRGVHFWKRMLHSNKKNSQFYHHHFYYYCITPQKIPFPFFPSPFHMNMICQKWTWQEIYSHTRTCMYTHPTSHNTLISHQKCHPLNSKCVHGRTSVVNTYTFFPSRTTTTTKSWAFSTIRLYKPPLRRIHTSTIHPWAFLTMGEMKPLPFCQLPPPSPLSYCCCCHQDIYSYLHQCHSTLSLYIFSWMNDIPSVTYCVPVLYIELHTICAPFQTTITALFMYNLNSIEDQPFFVRRGPLLLLQAKSITPTTTGV